MSTSTRSRLDSNSHAREAKKPELQLPPSNLPAEIATIGGALIGGHEIVDSVTPIIGPEDFYVTGHASVWRAILKLRDRGEPVDAITVFTAVRETSESDSDEELETLLREAMESVPYATSAHAEKYARDVAESSRQRQTIYAAAELSAEAYRPGADLDEAIATAETKLHSIIERKVTGQAMSMADVALETIARLSSPAKVGLPTGFTGLDQLTGGAKPGQLLVLAARPGVGKTALAGNLALNVVKSGTPVLFVSLEQSRGELFERFICGATGFTTQFLRSPRMHAEHRDTIEKAANALAELPLFIDDAAPRTTAQIAAQARLLRRRKNLGLVVIDYLQLLSPDDKRANREVQVAEISRSLKLLARNLEIPVIALAQLNRAVEARDNKRPRLSDIRESGAVEQDADIVMFIDRPRLHDNNADAKEAHVVVAKHRNGQAGDVRLIWEGATMQFLNPDAGDFT